MIVNSKESVLSLAIAIFMFASLTSSLDSENSEIKVKSQNSYPPVKNKLIVDHPYGRKIVNNGKLRQINATATSHRHHNESHCRCGVRKSHVATTQAPQGKMERITGGRLSAQQAWPWMAAIVFTGDGEPFWFCGASLINDHYVLTASHCLASIRRYGFSNIRIYLGTNEILSAGPQTVKAEISEVIGHPQYSTTTEDYDIALIRLKSKIAFSERIAPICLSQAGSPYLGRTATVAGWGSQTFGRAPPEALRDVNVKVTQTTKCQRDYYYNYNAVITSSMLCAWSPNKDSCQGDSGGPLFLRTKTTPHVYTQIGIVSFGPPSCGTSPIAGVYSRVSASIQWIKDNTKDANYCSGSFTE